MTTSPTATEAASAPATCAHCGSHDIYDVELEYAGTLGFRPDVHGNTPQLGDVIRSCGQCAQFAILIPATGVAEQPAPAAGSSIVAPPAPAPAAQPAAQPAAPSTTSPAAASVPAPAAPAPMPSVTLPPAPLTFPSTSEGGQ